MFRKDDAGSGDQSIWHKMTRVQKVEIFRKDDPDTRDQSGWHKMT